KEAKEKKQKKQADGTQSQTATKSKVYTNDEIPEAKSSPTSSTEAKTSKDSGSSSASTPGDAKAPSAQNPFPKGPDSAHVDFKFTTTQIKRPGTGETMWMVKNTSDHFEYNVALKTIVTGPCKYHREKEGSIEQLPPGGGETDNLQVNFIVFLEDCP